MDVLDWFARWYEAHCDGDWEHGFGPSITTIDNPGWSLKVDLAGTDCDGRVLDRVTHNYKHETNWWTCWTEADVGLRFDYGGAMCSVSLVQLQKTVTPKISTLSY